MTESYDPEKIRSNNISKYVRDARRVIGNNVCASTRRNASELADRPIDIDSEVA
jgi:hypothetical protein